MAPPRRKLGTPRAERIRTAAEAIGTQDEAARVAGVSTRQFRKYLSGESEPPTEVLSKIASSSGFSLDWLINGVGPPRTLNESANPLPGNIPAVLELRRKIYAALSEVYRDTRWPLDPASDADEFLLIDATEHVSRFPDALLEEAVELLAMAHESALRRVRR